MSRTKKVYIASFHWSAQESSSTNPKCDNDWAQRRAVAILETEHIVGVQAEPVGRAGLQAYGDTQYLSIGVEATDLKSYVGPESLKRRLLLVSSLEKLLKSF